MGDEREDRRRSLMGAGPLLGQLHFLPSVEANGVNVSKSYCYCQTRRMQENIRPSDCALFILENKQKDGADDSPCVDAEAVKGRTGSKE